MALYTAMDREERISRLRDKYLFDRERGLSTARAVLVTEAWKENLTLPAEIRRAKAYEHLLKNMPIYIVDEELIVGNLAEHPGDVNIYPEFGVDWILAELDRFSTRGTDPVQITEDQMAILRDILPWWRGKTVDDRVNEMLPDSEKFYRDWGLVVHSLPSNSSGIGHGTVDFEKVLNMGLEGMIAEAQDYLDKLDYTVAQNFEKREFYRSVIIVLNACLDYVDRFVALAREKAAAEENPGRKAELEKIAEVCERVPRYPAQTFHEALQRTWFVQAFGYLEQMGHGHAVGRPDQYLYKYYRQDIDNGALTQEEAQTLLASFWIKLNEPAPLAAEQMAALYAGFPTTEDLMVGGVKVEDGTDATNELSHMMLDADYDVSLIMPEFAVYVHKNADHEFLKHAAKLVRKGTGKPKFVNVECLQELYKTQGIPYTQEELNDIMLGGCGKCVSACPNEAIELVDGKVSVHFHKCLNCLQCAEVCMEGAIRKAGTRYTPQELYEAVIRDREFYGRRGGVTFTGGEPLAQWEFLLPVLKMLKEDEIGVCMDTTGYVDWSVLETVAEYVTIFLYDVKNLDSLKHREATGAANELILENLRKLAASGARIWLRAPIIPGYNDNYPQVRELACLAHELDAERLCLLPYHTLGREKYRQLGRVYPMGDTAAYTAEEIAQVRKFAEKYFSRVYVS